MTPERWRRARDVFEAALERAQIDRAAFVASACGEDDALRREVESLLAADEHADDFLAHPVALLLGESAPLAASVEPGQMLGRYRVIALLGVGGMGEVYLAEDPRLGRRVAVKLLPAQLRRDADRRRRFAQEARAASALSHPNVCVIYEVGELTDGRPFLAMEYIEGVSLRQRLQKGQISVRDAVEIAAQMAAGLAAAHEAGIVHRDVKPENVIVRPDRLVKVLDFGLAKRDAQSPRTVASAPIPLTMGTEPGLVLGTLHYMSPEQVRGLPVDPRTDIWSVGVVLYEMLVGRLPFDGDTSSDVLAAILQQQPLPVTTVSPAVPPALGSLVARALHKDPDKRYQSLKVLALDLHRVRSELPTSVEQPRWTRTDSIVHRPHSPPLRREPLLLAVLPFENLGDPANSYIADGIADEVRGKLAALPALLVLARTSSNQYRSTAKSPREVARELGVQYLLSGTVQWAVAADGARRVRVSPELLEVTDRGEPAIRWRQSFDATLADVFQVQADVASEVASALGLVLTAPAQAKLAMPPTESLAAYDAYLRSAAWTGSDVASRRRALAYAEEAVALDPSFAAAWAQVGVFQALLQDHPSRTRAGADAARQASERAIALAPDAPEGYMARGYCALVIDHDRSAALAAFRTAVKLAPSSPDAVRRLAVAERQSGDWEAALEHSQQAATLDPRSAATAYVLSTTLLWRRLYSEARAEALRGIALAPERIDLIQTAAMTYLGEGNLLGARQVLRDVPPTLDRDALVAFVSDNWDLYWTLSEDDLERVLRLSPAAFDNNRGIWSMVRAQVYFLRGETEQARRYAASTRRAYVRHLRRNPDDSQIRAVLALVLAYLGEREGARREGERAMAAGADDWYLPHVRHVVARMFVALGDSESALDQIVALLRAPFFVSSAWLRIDPSFAPLHGNPRFEQLAAEQ